MFGKMTQAAVMVVAMAVPALGQDWATKMFETTTHDFGTVARGERAEFEFVLENLYVEDVHIASVRASCRCTTPEIKTETLKTHQKGAIIAKYNTAAFLGPRGATLTVTIDKPFFAEVQLNVRGLIRGDVALEPGSVSFGFVDPGSGGERTITISHTGGQDWRIIEVRSGNSHLSATAIGLNRNAGQVTYQIVVHLDRSIPAGYLAENLTVVTNDSQSPQIQVSVDGTIRERISASPTPLFLGVMEPGKKAIKQIVVRSKEPFRVTEATCDGLGFEIAAPDGAVEKSLHVVPVTFVAPKDSGRVEATIHIETSLGAVTPVRAYADVTGR
ncbi:MAG: DUF1573 domain-containing protein [Thermoguttaceae bacterium]